MGSQYQSATAAEAFSKGVFVSFDASGQLVPASSVNAVQVAGLAAQDAAIAQEDVYFWPPGQVGLMLVSDNSAGLAGGQLVGADSTATPPDAGAEAGAGSVTGFVFVQDVVGVSPATVALGSAALGRVVPNKGISGAYRTFAAGEFAEVMVLDGSSNLV